VSNDTIANPQPIPNPVTLGGYVNLPGTGAGGQSQVSGDLDDLFQVDLLAGQRITMLVGDFRRADADLYLLDLHGKTVDMSIETGEVESVVVPEDGTYLVNVSAWRGATNYVLAIGATNIPAQYKPPRYEIVPWQAIVTYRDEHDSHSSQVNEEVSRKLGLEQRAGAPGRGRLMALRQSLASSQQRERRMGIARQKWNTISDPDMRARWETLMTIKSLRKNPRVRSARPNYRLRTLAEPNDEAYPLQWHYPLVGLPDAWDTTTGNADVVVAVIDTGILSGHPDLSAQLVDGYDFVRNPDSASDGDGIDPDPEDPGSSVGGGGESFHGTHVSGTVAAAGNNGRGVAGAAYGARVMPLRAISASGAGDSYDVEQALRYAAGLPNDSDTLPAQRADIINLSLGGAPFDPDTQNLLRDIRTAGVVVVAAAGNEASSAPLYPAAYDGVISVSAVDAQRRLAPYSNTGAQVDVSAPGGNGSVDLNGDGFPDGVLSTGGTIGAAGIDFGYTFLTGTSMASPHVAGIVALMISVNPALTPEDIDRLLAEGELSDDLGATGRDDLYGNGLINAGKAVLAALEASGTSPADNPRLVSSASTLNFGGTLTTLSLTLQNGGKGELALQGLSTSESWLTVAAESVDGDGLGDYRVSVDRAGLQPGIYAADITAQSSVNNLVVRVLASQGIGDGETDIGVIYVLLVDPVLNQTVGEVVPLDDGAGRAFRFTDVPAGEYEIVAGTDTDNDLFICDAGEACGAWLTVDQPIRIDVDEDIAGLDFPVEYLVSLPTINSAASPTPAGRARRLR
jgi:serine protease